VSAWYVRLIPRIILDPAATGWREWRNEGA
jgi:hypothetical protein